MRSTVSAIEDKMKAEIHSVWSELEEIIQHRIERVESCTEDLRKDLTETQMDLQAVKMSFDKHKADTED
jgi:hypothetical protein